MGCYMDIHDIKGTFKLTGDLQQLVISYHVASSSSSISNAEEKHEVFLSFRGEDTRKSFTSHLHAAFKKHDIRTYIDYNLQRGKEISGTLLRAIEDAKLSVIVFSKNYASSKWCLDELKKIIECKRTRGQIVVPVFYDIEPTYVRNQTGTYAIAFARHEQQFMGKMNKVKKWRVALTEATNYAGWDCSISRLEAEIVEEIAMDVLQKLNRVFVGDLDEEIAKYEQLAKLQREYYFGFGKPINLSHSKDYDNTLQRIDKLKMERQLRLLRISPDDNHANVEDSNADNDFDNTQFANLSSCGGTFWITSCYH